MTPLAKIETAPVPVFLATIPPAPAVTVDVLIDTRAPFPSALIAVADDEALIVLTLISTLPVPVDEAFTVVPDPA